MVYWFGTDVLLSAGQITNTSSGETLLGSHPRRHQPLISHWEIQPRSVNPFNSRLDTELSAAACDTSCLPLRLRRRWPSSTTRSTSTACLVTSSPRQVLVFWSRRNDTVRDPPLHMDEIGESWLERSCRIRKRCQHDLDNRQRLPYSFEWRCVLSSFPVEVLRPVSWWSWGEYGFSFVSYHLWSGLVKPGLEHLLWLFYSKDIEIRKIVFVKQNDSIILIVWSVRWRV